MNDTEVEDRELRRRRAVHEWLLRLGFAAWGLAIAISLLPLLRSPAPADQTAGYMKSVQLDASGPMQAVLLIIVIPFLAVSLSGHLVRSLSLPEARRWSILGSVIVLFGSLWIALVAPITWLIVLLPAALIAVFVRARRFDPRFSSSDAILVPAVLTLYLGLLDLFPRFAMWASLLVAIGAILALRLLLAAAPLTSRLEPSSAFLLAPLGFLLQSPHLSVERRHLGWPVILLVLLSPPILRWWLRDSPSSRRRVHRALAYVVLPLTFYFAPLAISPMETEGHPRVDIFEHGHSLLPASEMLRGERPFRDIVPGHGLIEDGLIDLFALRFVGETAGDVLRTRANVAALNSVAIYAVALAASGSVPVAILSFFYTALLLASGPMWIRSAPSLLSLAFVIWGMRVRSTRPFIFATIFAAIASLTSFEFGFYAICVLAVAIFRFSASWGGKLAALRVVLITGSAILIVLFSLFFGFGFLGSFLRTALVEIPSVAPAYAIGFFTFPPEITAARNFPDVLSALPAPGSLPYIIWPVILVFVAAMMMRAPFAQRRRTEPLVLIGLWIVLAGISYAERHHLYFLFAMPALIVLAISRLWRSRDRVVRVAAGAATIVAIIIGRPTAHLSVITILRTSRGPLEREWVEFWDLPRARFALFRTDEARRVRIVKEYLDRTLKPNETFFDFSNIPILYYLVDRPCPIRQYEVPFYQSLELQREVVRRLESDPTVRAALMAHTIGHSSAIDNIDNAARAPIVMNFLNRHFTPVFQEEGIIFWERKDVAGSPK